MKTFILMWNPAISSVKTDEFNSLITADWIDLNWSVWDYKEAEEGDRFFMVRVGNGNTGVVMSGTFESDPWEGEDWSGKGRKVFYCDLDVDTIINSDKAPILTTEELTRAIPEFDWTGGHSGQLVSKEIGTKLELLWTQFLYEHQTIFDDKDALTSECYSCDMANDIIAGHLNSTKDNSCAVCGYDHKKIWGKDAEHSNDYYIFWPDKYTEVHDSVLNHIHCLCGSCCMVNIDKQRERLGEPPYKSDEE